MLSSGLAWGLPPPLSAPPVASFPGAACCLTYQVRAVVPITGFVLFLTACVVYVLVRFCQLITSLGHLGRENLNEEHSSSHWEELSLLGISWLVIDVGGPPSPRAVSPLRESVPGVYK